MPLISALGRQRQADLCEFEVSLVYRVSSRTARATQRNPEVEGWGEGEEGDKVPFCYYFPTLQEVLWNIGQWT